MYDAWLDYQKLAYYRYAAEQGGLDPDDASDQGTMWWLFSKGWEAAMRNLEENADGQEKG